MGEGAGRSREDTCNKSGMGCHEKKKSTPSESLKAKREEGREEMRIGKETRVMKMVMVVMKERENEALQATREEGREGCEIRKV